MKPQPHHNIYNNLFISGCLLYHYYSNGKNMLKQTLCTKKKKKNKNKLKWLSISINNFSN